MTAYSTVTGPVIIGANTPLVEGSVVFTLSSWDSVADDLVISSRVVAPVTNGTMSQALTQTGDRGVLWHAVAEYTDFDTGRLIVTDLGRFALVGSGTFELVSLLGSGDAPPSTQQDALALAQAAATTAVTAANTVTAVLAITNDITTVAGIADDVTTVAGQTSQIATVAGQTSQIATVAAIDDDVATVAGIAGDVATVAGIAGDVATVADLYLGAHTTAPAPTVVGAWYLDKSVEPNVGRVWNGTAWITFGISSAATLLAGTALSGVENAHGSQVMLGAGGATPWNRAAGASDYLNPLFWQNGVTTSGVTATIAGTGVTADKTPYVDYDLAGTMTGQFATFGYIQTASNTAGLSGQSWTGSVFMAVLGPAGGGAGAAQIGSGVRVLVESAGNTSGNLITGSTPTLSTATRVLVADGTVSLRTHILGASGTVINARVRVYGLQLELAAQRTNGQYRELLPSEVRTLLDMSGIGSAATLSGPFVDRSGIPAHANEVTVMLSGVTRTGAQMPLLQAVVAGAAVTTGYLATSSVAYGSTLATADFTAGFGMNNSNASADVLGGQITLTRFAAGSNLWIASGQIHSVQGAPQAISVQGQISLAGPLSGLRFNGNGATLTAGSVALTWRV